MLTSDPEYIINNSVNTIEYMSSNRISPTPDNYHLWYTYSGKYDLSLSNFVDKLVLNKTPIDDVVSERLYKKFSRKTLKKKLLKKLAIVSKTKLKR
jgi:hypothetical protein